MAFHYYDPDAGGWRSIDNPTAAQIAEALAATRPACAVCDPVVEFVIVDGRPEVEIVHEDDCPAA